MVIQIDAKAVFVKFKSFIVNIQMCTNVVIKEENLETANKCVRMVRTAPSKLTLRAL